MSNQDDLSKPQADTRTAIRWSAASRYGAQLMQFVISLTLARLLAPEHFGLLGMATVVVGFAKRCSDLGFRAAIIQRKEVDRPYLSTVFWVNLAIMALVSLVLASCSPLVAKLYREPRVTWVLVALALNFSINSFSMLPNAMLQRSLQFKSLALRELVGTAFGGIVAIIMACLGFGVWALVASMYCTSICNVILLNAFFPIPISFSFDRERLREALSFGLNLTGADIFNYLARHADNLIIGAALGPVALGYYSFAYKLMLLPRNSLTQVVNRVLFPKLSREQDNDAAIASISLRACSAIVFLSFPMMAGLAVLAEPFTRVVVGEKWLPAVPILWILAPLGAIQSIWPMATYLMLAKGRTDISLRWAILSGSVLLAGFCVGSFWGIVGVASSYAVCSVVLIPTSFMIAYRLVDGLQIQDLAKVLAPYFLASSAMAIVVGLTFRFTSPLIGDAGGLLLAVVSGMLSYLLIAVWSPLPALAIFLDLLPYRFAKLSRNIG